MKNTYRAPTHLFAIIGALIEGGGRAFDRSERHAIRYFPARGNRVGSMVATRDFE